MGQQKLFEMSLTWFLSNFKEEGIFIRVHFDFSLSKHKYIFFLNQKSQVKCSRVVLNFK